MSDRAAWLERRRYGIGSSECAAILGVNPWATAIDVWRSKVEEPAEDKPSRAMQAGTELERLALEWAAEELGQEVTRHDQTVSLEHPRHPAMRATPDGYAADGWIVEAKVTGDPPWDEVPIHYLVQVQHQLAVTGLPGAYVAQVSRGRLDVTMHRVERHEGLIRRLEIEIPEWWERHVVGGEPPAPQTAREVVMLHPQPEGVIRLGLDGLGIVEERERVSAEIRELESRKHELTDMLARTIGAAEVAVLPDGRAVTYRATKASEYTVKREAGRSLRVTKRVPKGLDESTIPGDETPVR